MLTWPFQPTHNKHTTAGQHFNPVHFFILLWLCCCSLQGQASQILTDKIDLNCSQTEAMLLACSYRLLFPATTVEITAKSGNNRLEIPTNKIYPATDSITAVLFLVDTSDPGRQEVISKNASQISQILGKMGAHHRAGLASFNKELVVNVPVGGTISDINAAAKSLTETGLTTELYRNTIKAIDLLSRTNADRKVIFLMSDGQAEDKAYFHEDVIKSASNHGVIINSLGFPRSIALSVALQTLRRMSEETGGLFIETDMRFELPESFLQTPFDNIDRGGQFIVDLVPLSSTLLNCRRSISILIHRQVKLQSPYPLRSRLCLQQVRYYQPLHKIQLLLPSLKLVNKYFYQPVAGVIC